MGGVVMERAVELRYEDNIAVVQLKVNTFTENFSRDIMSVYAEIKENKDVKAVIVHGYDTYFSCGGSKEELKKLTANTDLISFDDLRFYRLQLDCELPTISAMHGHGLGGGLAFGCFGDIVLMSESSMYGTNFMRYGFTPGMGATYIVPKKLGYSLGNEMLFSANYYFGRDLKTRGVGVRVLPASDVIPAALSIAKDLAQKPLTSLKLLKKHLAEPIRKELETVIEQEKAMHRITMKLPEVQDLIERNFSS
jgi:polyketide biosynthesis enoyl-CoA hydratase PksI